MKTHERVGIFVDAVNVTMNGGYGLRYDILRMFACRGGGVASRLNVYLCYDADRLKEDHEYRKKTQRFCEVLRDFEYKVTEKPVQTYTNHETGKRSLNPPLIWTWPLTCLFREIISIKWCY